MTTDEDARTAARRIVEQVLTSGASASGPSGRAALADEVVDDVVIELRDEFDVADPIAIVEDVAEDLAEDADVAIDDVAIDDVAVDAVAVVDVDVSEPRARARALVAEVLAAHARTAPAEVPPASPPQARHTGPPADSASRLRARELVAAALADAEERRATARAEAEARAAEELATAEAAARAEAEVAAEREREREAARRIEEGRRAEEERAEAERARREAIEHEQGAEEERLARERERAAAEERERALWADPGPDDGAETTPVDVPDRDDRTVPMSVAELAATGPPDGVGDDRMADPGEQAAATGTLALPRPDSGGEVEERRAVDGRSHEEPRVLEQDPRVLEAVVDLDTPLPPARGGRWLLVSVIGAITLAVVFPLAIRALLQLVALS